MPLLYSKFWALSFSFISFHYIFTGAQLRHNYFRIYSDPSRIFTYNCVETFQTTSLTLSEHMPGLAYGRNKYG